MSTPAWLTHLASRTGPLTLVDLVVVLLVLGSFVGALRRRRGLVAAVGSALGTALLCWVAAAAVTLWAPPSWSHAVRASALAGLVPLPVTALREAGRLVSELLARIAARS